MPHYKDTNNNLHFLDDPKFAYLLPEDSIEISDEEALQPIVLNKAQKLQMLTTAYKSDMSFLQLNYLSIICQGGADEETKKADARQEMLDRKTQYLQDIAAIKSGTL